MRRRREVELVVVVVVVVVVWEKKKLSRFSGTKKKKDQILTQNTDTFTRRNLPHLVFIASAMNNNNSSSQMMMKKMKHIAFSKPHVDDDSRVEALDGLMKEEEMMMSSKELESEMKNAVLDASNSALIRAKCFALLQRMNKSNNKDDNENNSIIYEQMCVHPIRERMMILDESNNSNSKEQLLKRVLFALDACGKINVFFEEEEEDLDEKEEKEGVLLGKLTNEVVKFCIGKLYIVEDSGGGATNDAKTTKDMNRELYTASVACLSSLAKKKKQKKKKKNNTTTTKNETDKKKNGGLENGDDVDNDLDDDGTSFFTIEDIQSLLRYVEKGTSVGDSQGTLACGGSLRVLTFLMPKLLEQKRRKYGLLVGGGSGGGVGIGAEKADGNAGDNNDIVVANFLGQGRRTGVEEMELKMYSKTIIIGEEGNNDNSIYSSKKVVDVFDRVDFNAVTALVGKKTLQSGHHVPAWIKSAGCEYLAHCARKKEDFVLLAKACTDKRHWSVRLAALKAFAKLGFHSRPYYTQLILFNAHDEICEIREQLCETLKKSWQGKQCEPKTDGSDDLKLFQAAECVGELMRDPDAGVRAKAIECLGYVRGAANTRRTEMARMLHGDSDETVREMAADSLARLGFLNVNTGEISADGNYRTAKFLSNKRLFLQLIAAEQATIIQEMGGIVGHVAIASGGGGGGGGGGGANDDDTTANGAFKKLTNAATGVNASAKILTDKSQIIKLEKMKNIKVKEGDTIRVFWPDDKEWYEAKVVQAEDYKKSGKKTTKICYSEDGVEEEIDIRNERVELRYKPHKKGCRTQWVPCGNQESERIKEERRKQFAMQKALREAERLAEMEIRREQREMEKKEKEKEKEEMQKLEALRNVETKKLDNEARKTTTTIQTTGGSRNGFWKTIAFSGGADSKKEEVATDTADGEADAEKCKEHLEASIEEEKRVTLNDADIKLLRGLVDQKIKIYWPLDKVWYVADVLSFDEETKKVKVLYVEDQLEEEVELWTERSQQYVPPTDMSHKDLRGITPLRVPVEVGGVEGYLEIGARRHEEYIVFNPPTTSGKKRKRLDTDTKKTKWHAMKGSDFERKFNKLLSANAQRRWRKNVAYNPRGWQDCKESNLSSTKLKRKYGNEKMPLLKWLITQGDQWGGVVIGKTLELDLNCHRGSQFVFKNGYAVFEEEEGEEEEEGALKEATKSTDWLLCKITDYNVQSGEHLVCPIDENGIIAGDAVWMVLASQRTKPTKNEDQEEKEEQQHHHPENVEIVARPNDSNNTTNSMKMLEGR